MINSSKNERTKSDWAKIKELKHVKKYRVGRHRFYITGQHTNCNYDICFVLANKRDSDDQPDKDWFQRRIIQALSIDSTRVLVPPPPPSLDEEDENEQESLLE